MDVYISAAVSVSVTLAKRGHMFETGLAPRKQNIANNKALVWNITPTHTHKEAHNIKMDVYIGAALIVCVPLAKRAHPFEMRLTVFQIAFELKHSCVMKWFYINIAY